MNGRLAETIGAGISYVQISAETGGRTEFPTCLGKGPAFVFFAAYSGTRIQAAGRVQAKSCI